MYSGFSYLLWTGSSPSLPGKPGTSDMSWHQGLRNSCSLSLTSVSCPLGHTLLSHSSFSVLASFSPQGFVTDPSPCRPRSFSAPPSGPHLSPSVLQSLSPSVSRTLCFNPPSLIVFIHTAAILGRSSSGLEAEKGGAGSPKPPLYPTHLKSWGLRGGTRIKTTQRRLLFCLLVCSIFFFFLRGSPRNVGCLIF